MTAVAIREERKAPAKDAHWRDKLDYVAPSFTDALPSHVTLDKFKRIVANAIAGSRDIQDALQRNPSSVWSACMACAKDGLIPDGREAAIVAYAGAATYMPMISGILKLIRQSGEVASISAHVVHENDEFEYILGDEEKIIHKPVLNDRGKLIAAYAIIRTKDGAYYRDIMGADDIAKVRSIVKAKKTPWNGPFEGEMWKKTVLRRLAKRAPLSTDIMDVISRDDHIHDLDRAERLPSVPKQRLTLEDLGRPDVVEHEQFDEPHDDGLPVSDVNEDITDIEPDEPEQAAESVPENAAASSGEEEVQPPEHTASSSSSGSQQGLALEGGLPRVPTIDFSEASDKELKLWQGAMIANIEGLSKEKALRFWLQHVESLDCCDKAFPDVYRTVAAVYEKKTKGGE